MLLVFRLGTKPSRLHWVVTPENVLVLQDVAVDFDVVDFRNFPEFRHAEVAEWFRI